MNYKGKELVEVSNYHIPNLPKKMLVWNDNDNSPKERMVRGAVVDAFGNACFITSKLNCAGVESYFYCAEIPEETKPRRVTWKELAYWLMDGKGLVYDENTSRVDTGVIFKRIDLDAEVSDNLKVMRRDDNECHEPTAEYLGLEE